MVWEMADASHGVWVLGAYSWDGTLKRIEPALPVGWSTRQYSSWAELQGAKDGEGFGGVGKAPPGLPGGGGLGWYLSNGPAGWLGREQQGGIPFTPLGAPGSVWTPAGWSWWSKIVRLPA